VLASIPGPIAVAPWLAIVAANGRPGDRSGSGLLHQLGRLVLWGVHHPRQVLAGLAVLAVIAVWEWLRFAVARRWKKALPGPGVTVWRLLRLVAVEEDRRWRLGYAVAWLSVLLLMWAGPAGSWRAWSLQLVVAVPLGRSGFVSFQRRRKVTKKLFDVAADVCKYDKNAHLRWRRWIKVRWNGPYSYRWVDIHFPTRFDSKNDYYRKKLIRQLNKIRRHVWEFDWRDEQDVLRISPVSPVPEEAFLEAIEDPNDWRKIRLGKILGGRDLVIDLARFPHIFIGGPTNTGKSVLQRVIAAQLMGHPDKVRIIGCDPLEVELGWLRGKPGVELVADSLQSIAEVISRLINECQRRQLQMTEEGVEVYFKLQNPPPAIAFIFDEVTEGCATSKRKDEASQAKNELKNSIADGLEELGRIGRKFGIHLILATQRPDVRLGLSGNLMSNIAVRILTGRTTRRASLMILESTYGNQIESVPGRQAAVIGLGSEPIDVQGYLLDRAGLEQLPFIDMARADEPVLSVLHDPDATAVQAAAASSGGSDPDDHADDGSDDGSDGGAGGGGNGVGGGGGPSRPRGRPAKTRPGGGWTPRVIDGQGQGGTRP
jgi:hypothetical protein